jgi:hypothetical protein
MLPSIGRTIIIRGSCVAFNGADRAPAIITRTWSHPATETKHQPCRVNATAFPDMAAPVSVGSVLLFDSEDEANASLESASGNAVAFWPARV